MKKKLLIVFILISYVLFMYSCNGNDSRIHKNIYNFGFENVDEFSNYYIVPLNYMNTSSQELSNEQVHSGTYSHKAWIYGANPDSSIVTNNNHRAYPTIQVYKDSNGAIITPCYITLYIWLDIELQERSPENEWFSFASLSTDASDSWNRVICVNLSSDNIVHLMHTPYQGSKEWVYQTTDVIFPMREWVKLTIYIDTTPDSGYIKVYQNDILVSEGLIKDGNGTIAQMHFGLYAAPSVASGIVYNDDLEIREVDRE